tara:strand:- start:1864 stop:3243 length:1380 start_codon:yes stop_codon:yes gene_type:complete
MSNILTDILGFFKRRKFAEQAKDSDVLILGVNESPDMLGIASPVPYKDVKLITVKSLLGSNNLDVLYQNIGSGSEVYAGQSTVGDQKYENFRSLKSVSLNLTINQTASEIQFNTTAEPNTAANVGSGAELYKNKVGETLNFRSIISSDASVGITQDTNEIDLTASGSGEVNTASNVGTGTGLFKQKAAEDLEFYSLTSSDNSVDIDLIAEDNLIDLKTTTGSNTQGAGTFLSGARFAYKSPTDLTYFNTAISAITDFGFGYFDLPDVSGIPTSPLTQISYGNRFVTDPIGDYVENYVGLNLSYIDWPNLPATARIRVIFTCYAEASVPPTVIYLGLHNRNQMAPLANNTELQYGWQAVGVDPDTDNQLTQVQATWIIDVDDVVDTQGRSLRTDSSASGGNFGFYAGSNASRDKLFFGAQWNAEIPNAIDQQWAGPAIAEIHVLDNNPTGRFQDNPFTRA